MELDALSAEFERRLAVAPLSPGPVQRAEMIAAWAHLAGMLTRIPDDLTWDEEPANAFSADASSGPEGER